MGSNPTLSASIVRNYLILIRLRLHEIVVPFFVPRVLERNPFVGLAWSLAAADKVLLGRRAALAACLEDLQALRYGRFLA